MTNKLDDLNVSEEFMLKEYEACWRATDNCIKYNDSWFRFFLIMISAVGSVFVFTFTKNGKVDLEEARVIAGALLTALFFIGVLTLFIQIRILALVVEYFNSVNRIRRYFIEKNLKSPEDTEYCKYFLLKHTDDLKVFKFSANFFRCIAICILNTLLFTGILYFFGFWSSQCLLINIINVGIIFFIFLVQIIGVVAFLTIKDKKYKDKEQKFPYRLDKKETER